MDYILFFYFLIFFTLVPTGTHAFLPPQFFVQGISSVVAVIGGGIAIAALPMAIFIKFAKKLFKEHKKIMIAIILQNILIAILLGLFFYYKYYKPLYEDSYLFPKASSTNVNPLDKTIEPSNPIDPKELNKNYTLLENTIRDKKNIVINHDYGVEPQEIKKKEEDNIKVYYLDIREAEEFDAGHISGAKQIRGSDIANTDTIKNVFGLTDEEFKNSFVVVYCHDGERSFYTAKSLNENNIKYLIGGTEGLDGNKDIPYTGSYLSDKKIFGDEYQKDFQTLAPEASKMITGGNAFVIDMRLGRVFAEKHIKGSLHFLYNTMTNEEYGSRLNKVLENKDKDIIFIVDRYTELFYTNLLIMRLENNYQFPKEKFHILFSQFQSLESNPLIEFETGYNQP